MPRFSVIVGVHNQAATLPALMSSLDQQTFRDFEVHFCDDGSDDGSKEIIENYVALMNTDVKDPLSLRYFYHRQEHQGMRLAKNINQGIRYAQGEYCVFVMGDSMLELDYLEQLDTWVAQDRIVCGIRIQIAQIAGKMEGVDIDWRMKKLAIPEVASVIIDSPWQALTGNGLTIPTEALRLYGPWCEEIEGYGGEDNEIVARLYFKGYLCWSVPELRLYHVWHKSKESLPKNAKIVWDKIQKYAGITR